MTNPEQYKGSEQEQNTLNFIASYLLCRRFTADDISEHHTSGTEMKNPSGLSSPRDWDGNIQRGDVRLLADLDGFQYVAVLEKRGYNYLVVPYSAYHFPATDTELKLERSGGECLEVLQIWNVRTMHYLQLKKSWMVASLSAEELDEIFTVRSHYLLHTELPAGLTNRIGIPIFNFLDPRVKYQEDALKLFAEIDRRDFELQDFQEEIDEKLKEKLQQLMPVQLEFAAAGKKSLTSEVYDASEFCVFEILGQLHVGEIPGSFTDSAVLEEFPEEEMIWDLTHWRRKGRHPVLFWLRSQGKILGFGEAVTEEVQGAIFLRCSNPEISIKNISVDDIIIFIGRE